MKNIYLEDWNQDMEVPPTATAVDESDFFEGMKVRRDFIVDNNPYNKITKLSNRGTSN